MTGPPDGSVPGVSDVVSGEGLAGLVGLDPQRLSGLIAALVRRNRTVACAESLTGGLLAALLTSVPGASAAVRGGIVCYATDLKSSLVGVDAALLAERGPVDPEVARQLAAGVRERCGASIGLGLTGVAGPDSQGGQPPGTVYVGIAGCGPAASVTVPMAGVPLTRAAIRAAAVRCALDVLEGRADDRAGAPAATVSGAQPGGPERPR